MKIHQWKPGQKISEPGVYAGVPMATYHGPDLCVGPSISSSGLRTIFTDCPMSYWITSPYNPNPVERVDSRAFVIGRAAHHLCLGEADFQKHFIVRPDKYPDEKGALKAWTRAAHYCKAWEAGKAAEGLDILTPAELETIKGLAGIQPWQKGLEDSGLMNNALVRAGALQGLVEHTIVAKDKETGVWLKSRPDVIPTGSAEGVDFKTCASVEEYKLIKSLEEFRYDIQGRLFSECLEQAADIRMTNFSLIYAEKAPPFEVAVRELKAFELDEAEKDMRVALRTFALCMENGKWPGRGGAAEDAKYIERSPYARERADRRREQLSREVFG